MEKVLFRKAKKSDWKKVISIMESVENLQKNFPGLSKKEIEKRVKSNILKKDRFTQVLLVKKELIGFSSFESMVKFPYINLINKKLKTGFAYGTGISIHAKYHGKGYGFILRKYSLEKAKKVGFSGMYVSIDPANKISINLHKKVGFKELMKFKKDNGEKRILFYKKY